MSNASTVIAIPAHSEREGAWLAVSFALTVFVSAFLLFQIEPLISKFILPWFGGSPAVWTTCAALLSSRAVLRLRLRSPEHALPRAASARVIVHCALLALRRAAAPRRARRSLQAARCGRPDFRHILVLAERYRGAALLRHCRRQVRSFKLGSAVRTRSALLIGLYALSNLGSLLALLSYPFLVRARVRRAHASAPLVVGFWRLSRRSVRVCAPCARYLRMGISSSTPAQPVTRSAAPPWRERLALGACCPPVRRLHCWLPPTT